ncbi:MAG TPA: hypothetical protein VJB87_05055, partial [Candidatus Nanoarchaeia archaeon]|nr:hypothetical protein [Candidatus Nanoarchaeia archaeon]
TLHLATQLPGRYLDHLGDNQTHSHPGTYQGWTNEKRVTTFVYTLPPAIATPEKNLITTLEEGGYEQKINDSEGTDKPSETLEGLFQAKMRQALQANTPTNFEQWLRKTPQILQLTYA